MEGTAARRGEGAAALEQREVERRLRRGADRLSDQQRAALLGLSTSGHGIESVEALAGTGKTYLAGALRELYERAGYSVVGVAPTGRGARELREQAGIAGASTLARLLIDLERDGGLAPRTVVILDEAGMASTRETAALVSAAQQRGREADRDRRLAPARERRGRRLARLACPPLRRPPADRGHAPARRDRASPACRRPRPAPGRLPSPQARGRRASPLRLGAGGRARPGRGLARPTEAGALRPGRDDRPRQRDARALERGGPRGAPRRTDSSASRSRSASASSRSATG